MRPLRIPSATGSPANLLMLSLQKEKSNPIYGISSEGYKGKGHVQSKSAKSQGIKIEEDE